MNGLLDDPRQLGLLGLALGMLEQGGPQRQPVSVGQALARGGMHGLGMYQQAMKGKQEDEDRKVQRLLRDMQMRKLRADTEQEEAENRFFVNLPDALRGVTRSAVGDYGPGEAPNVTSTPDLMALMLQSRVPSLQKQALVGLTKQEESPYMSAGGGLIFNKRSGQYVPSPPKADRPANNDYLEILDFYHSLPANDPRKAEVKKRLDRMSDPPQAPIQFLQSGDQYVPVNLRTGARVQTPPGQEPIPAPAKDKTKNEASLRKEFEDRYEVKTFRAAIPVIESARSAPNTSQGDLQLIYAAGKVLDPNSVVREGEMSLVVKSGSPVERISGFMGYLAGGGRLTPTARANLVKALEGRVVEYQRDFDQVVDDYKRIALASNLQPDRIIVNVTSLGRAEDDGAIPDISKMTVEQLKARRDQLRRKATSGGQ